MIEIGSVDRVTSVVGEKGTGKSTFAVLDARQFQREAGALVVGHSPNGQIGMKPDIEFHDSMRSLRRGIRRRPEFMHFIASGASPEDVIEEARAMSLDVRKRAVKRAGHKFNPLRPAPAGVQAAPILIIIDEGTHLKRGMSNHEKEELGKFLTATRHEHIAISMLIQAPTARSWLFQEQSSRFRVFRYMHEWGSNAVRAAGVPSEEMERIKTLPKFSYFAFDKDAPETAGYRRLPDPTP